MVSKKITLITLFFCLLVTLVKGQVSLLEDPKIPQVLPPSPEAAGIIRNALGSANLSTGAISASVPLYTLAVNGFSWPIALSYSSQGLRTDEPSSRVGYGWSLIANGVITRLVKDDPDDFGSPIYPPSNFFALDQANFDYCEDATSESTSYDTQPDEYNFSFNGYSGKFIFDSLGNIRLISHSNVKVEAIGAREHFVITTTDGIKYKFGDAANEKTVTYNLDISALNKSRTKTSFFLYRIEIPGGAWINFNYNSINVLTVSGYSQTLRLGHGSINMDWCGTCTAPGQFVDLTAKSNRIEYYSRYLSSITTSSGLTASFNHEGRPDMSGDNRLKSFTVNHGSTRLKRFTFDYYDPPGFDGSAILPDGTTSVVGRFFLTKLTDKEIVTTDPLQPLEEINHDYVFTYNRMDLVPKPNSPKQDHWGFYNGNPGNLLQSVADFYWGNGTPHPAMTGDRSPNGDSASRGVLTAVHYPTGGKEEFFYEPNSIVGSFQNPYGPMIIELAGNYQGSNTHYSYFSSSFTVPYEQNVTLEMFSIYHGTGTPPSGRIVQFYLKEGADTIYQTYLNDNSAFTSPKTLKPGRTYRMEMKIRNDWQNAGQFRIQYDTAAGPTYSSANVPIGGIRLRKIKYTSPESGSTHSKYYRYATLNNLAFSSGVAVEHINYRTSGSKYDYCSMPGIPQASSLCNYLVYNSNTTFNISGFNGSHIYYRNVIESDDSLFANGGTEYQFFYPSKAYTNVQDWGETVDAMPSDNHPTLNGSTEYTRVFDKNFTTVQEQYDRYDTVKVGSKVYGMAFKKKYTPVYMTNDLEIFANAYDISRYYYETWWIRKVASISKTYAGNNVSSYDSVRYTYNSVDNILPATTTTFDSKNNELKVEQKYPTDYTGNAVLSEMVTRNMISQPVESKVSRNAVLQQHQQTSYKKWFPSWDIIKPDTIKVKSSKDDVLAARMLFEKYDSAGNILQVRKVSDNPVSYIWGHAKMYPIAEVMNASADQVAYTSFEDATAMGNWEFVGSPTYHEDGFTGSKSISGTVQKTGLPPGEYDITVWTKNATAPLINGSLAALLKTKGVWKLYAIRLTNPGSVVVNGLLLDELHLSPTASVMNTVVYKTFVGAVAKSNNLQNDVSYYSYDPFLRLRVIRDIDSNIIQQYRYRYLDTITNCGGATANWVATGLKKCIVTGANNNYNGYEQEEQRDESFCSDTYLQTRWVTIGVTGNCTPIPDCTGENKRVVNGVCETGVRGYTNTVKINATTWQCTYHYEFSDGYWSPDNTHNSPIACFSLIEDW
ncbi:hypothetical protein [Polluticaenibacter yanchengensis]|uniref:RHS repeat-associated core domain-containing protein n=1 Tax=Polluticaenibacter yanchengensis TaxID=3014562 RepID=A0ABT4UPS1_9BACT|nr:hypothetical protein [Chitinophagaceae bacterium LY-5]